MIKIDTGKEKELSFDIEIDGGNFNEIKEGRFILSCSNKTYGLMFDAIVKEGKVVVHLPSLNFIDEKMGKCSLEMISNDNQYYQVWEDEVKFDKGLKIKIQENKETERSISVIGNKNNNNKKVINENKKRSSETRTLYRTIKSDSKTINTLLSENKFFLKPKSGLNVKFYKNDSMLINDIENIEYGICIGMSVPGDGIIQENKDHTLIVDSSCLDKIDEKNVLFLIKEGQIIQINKKNLNDDVGMISDWLEKNMVKE